jgi:hypothetical protein
MLQSLLPHLDHDRDQDITQRVNYVYCISNRAVKGGVQGSADVVTIGWEVVPYRGGVGRVENHSGSSAGKGGR